MQKNESNAIEKNNEKVANEYLTQTKQNCFLTMCTFMPYTKTKKGNPKRFTLKYLANLHYAVAVIGGAMAAILLYP